MIGTFDISSRRRSGDAYRRSRRRLVDIVERGRWSGGRHWTQTQGRAYLFVAAVLASALGLQAQPLGDPFTFDAAFRLALHLNADIEAIGRQQAIRDAQRIRDAAHLRGQAITDADCPPACPNVVPSLAGCPAGAAQVTMTGGLLTADEVTTSARTLRRNVRQAFYDLLLRDEEIDVAQGVVDFATQLRVPGRGPSDAGMTVAERLDALRVEIAFSRATVDLIRAQSERRAAEGAFNTIVNWPLYVPVALTGTSRSRLRCRNWKPAIRLAKAFDPDLARLRHDLDVQRGARGSVAPADPRAARRQRTNRSAARRTSAGPERSSLREAARDAQKMDLRIVQLDTERALRERAIEACLREEFVRIDAERRDVARFEQILIPAGDDLVTRTAEEFRAGHVAARELLDAQHSLVGLRRDYLAVLHELRLHEADVEERLPALGLQL